MNTGRAADVIRLATDKAGWGKSLPEGFGLGLAFHFSHAGHFAEVAEVSVSDSKELTIHHVTVAADIGPVVNLSGAENQCQGSVTDGLSTMFGLEITIENGHIQQQNFDTYQPLRITSTPEINVYFIQNDFAPTDTGHLCRQWPPRVRPGAEEARLQPQDLSGDRRTVSGLPSRRSFNKVEA